MGDGDFWQAILYLHLLAMAFFVGGQLVFVAAVVPVLRRAPEERTEVRAIARRFGYGSLVALGVLLATGWAMASHYDLFGDPTLQWKLGLVGAVVGLTAVHLRRPRLHALQAAILVLSLAIVWLGLELVV